MPKRTDIKRILIIGSGPIIIGQACEFDYSGSQACKALKEEGFKVVLVNSNPATIMTDPDMADRVYVEPIIPEVVARIIARERPEALLPTLGGQTGLNVASHLAREGILERYNVELIGAKFEAILKAEDRGLFKEAMKNIGLRVPQSQHVRNVEEALDFARSREYPFIIRPSYTLAGTGGGVAYNVEELREIVARGLEYSPVSEVLVEESVIGWKEFELEVMRDLKDNVVIICSIENLDPMGIHTGDSITVAPAQTLTDKEYQRMRDAAIRVIREIGVETGGSNIQFAINPDNGEMVVIEMNPRVSRSSALASKATGFPIAKIAAKLAVGYTLDEIPNDITRKTPACFEPAIDYCVVKIPRWDFEKFPSVNQEIGTQMKSVGEVMAIGRTFKEALQKALRSGEKGRYGLGADGREVLEIKGEASESLREKVVEKLQRSNPDRIFYLRYAFQVGMNLEEIYQLTRIDPWFLHNIRQIVEMEEEIIKNRSQASPERIRKAKEYGFSDHQLSYLLGKSPLWVRKFRKEKEIKAVFKQVDTCAAEFEAYTPYYYSTYEVEDEGGSLEGKKVVILGGGPNRIGQGIEFDYCCVQAVWALREEGYKVIMVNCNPETVSTDYDTPDRLYFEPLTLEDVLNILDKEKPQGVMVQFGGQTPLNLSLPLLKEGVPILGTSPLDIDRAEDRDKFKEVVMKLQLHQAPNGVAKSYREAKEVARRIGYPLMVRPSYVLGGRAMEIVYDEASLEEFMVSAVKASPEHPVLIDKFLEDAIEIDVDAVADGERCIVCGIMEHIEEAGIHSGDSACVIPPYSLSDNIQEEVKRITCALARELRVVGLMNIQFAVKNGAVYVLEVNPRASRTVPFVSKATGIPWARIAAKLMMGRKLDELGIKEEVEIPHVAVKEAVFPFNRFPGVDPVLGPEMKSTGEVMGIDGDFGRAYAKSQLAAGTFLPQKGTVFISVKDKDKRSIVFIAKRLADMGFKIIATRGTARVLARNGIEVRPISKVYEGRPNVIDFIKNGGIDLVINTPTGKKPRRDELSIRSVAVMHNIPIITTIFGAQAAVNGIEALIKGEIVVRSLQEYQRTAQKKI